jgi:hypothetical protein
VAARCMLCRRSVITRALFGVLIATSLAGCGHERPPVASTAERDQLGCFRLLRGPYTPDLTWGGDEVFIEPPDLIELLDRPSHETFARDNARMLRPVRPASGRPPAYGEWWPLEGEQVRLVWGDGFSGVGMTLRKDALGYHGTANTFWDFDRPSQMASVSLNRVNCGSAAEPAIAAAGASPRR